MRYTYRGLQVESSVELDSLLFKRETPVKPTTEASAPKTKAARKAPQKKRAKE